MNKKLMSGIIIAIVIVLIVIAGIKISGNSSNEAFDPNNVVLKIATISDIHIVNKDDKASKRLAAALSQLKERANGKLDVLFMTGDLTDFGLPEQVVELKRVIDNSGIDLHKTRLVAAIGNHEYYDHILRGAEWKGGYLLKDVFGDVSYIGAADEEIKAGDYHTVVNGYDFIVVNCAQYEEVGATYNASDIEWLKKHLADAAEKHPGKPIFVGSHPNIIGTNLGSNDGNYWASSQLYDVLKDYPQAIYFCGHLHFPENDERSIWQGDFTTVDLGSTYYLSNHLQDDATGNEFVDIHSGYETFDAYETPSQGLYMEVDKNSNVRITRLDFSSKEEIKEPWIIPAPKNDKSQLKFYTPEAEFERFAKTAPIFPDTASVKEISKADNKYTYKFTQAKDNDLVYCYRVSFIDGETKEKIKTISTLSDFYMHAKPGSMASTLTKTIAKADSVLAPFSLEYPKDYYIQIVAVDCFGQESKPVVSKVIEP